MKKGRSERRNFFTHMAAEACRLVYKVGSIYKHKGKKYFVKVRKRKRVLRFFYDDLCTVSSYILFPRVFTCFVFSRGVKSKDDGIL